MALSKFICSTALVTALVCATSTAQEQTTAPDNRWSEVGAMMALGSVSLEPQPPTKSPGEMYAFIAGVDYRHAIVDYVQVGVAASYAVYGYPNYLQGGSKPVQNNHATTFMARVIGRTSSMRTKAAWLLNAGFGVAHVRQYKADLKEDDDATVVYSMPDVARWDPGLNLGLGFETGTFAGDVLRFRFAIDYFLSPSSDGIQIVNFVPSVSLSASF